VKVQNFALTQLLTQKTNNMKKRPTTIACNGYNVPTGTTANDRAQRKQLIKQFYKNWAGENVERKVKNEHLKQFIHVNRLSVKETEHWACLSFRSTLTVLELSYVLKHAVKVGNNVPKSNRNQKQFDDILIMECIVPKLRPYVTTAKLTVGIVKGIGNKVQYCLTAK
jgi:hypothetical protein